jgi:hypothetical protein
MARDSYPGERYAAKKCVGSLIGLLRLQDLLDDAGEFTFTIHLRSDLERVRADLEHALQAEDASTMAKR